MRKILLVVPILFFSLLVMGQSSIKESTLSKAKVTQTAKVYPNPAYDFIGLNNFSDVSAIIVYNLVGRKMKKFVAQKGERYDITDLPRGMYLVQLLGTNGKIVTTQRMSKK